MNSNLTIFSYESCPDTLIGCLDLCKRFKLANNPKIEIVFESLDQKQKFESEFESHLNSNKKDPATLPLFFQSKSLLISKALDSEKSKTDTHINDTNDPEEVSKSTDIENSDLSENVAQERTEKPNVTHQQRAILVTSQSNSQSKGSEIISDSQSSMDPQQEEVEKTLEQLNMSLDNSFFSAKELIKEKEIEADPIKMRYLFLHHDLKKLLKDSPCKFQLTRSHSKPLRLIGYENNVAAMEKKILKISNSLHYCQLNRSMRYSEFQLLIQAQYSTQLRRENNVFLVSYPCDFKNLRELEAHYTLGFLVGTDPKSLEIVKRGLDAFAPKRIILWRVEKMGSDDWKDQFTVMNHYINTIFDEKLREYVKRLNPDVRLELKGRETNNIKETYFIISNFVKNFMGIQSLINLKGQELFLLTFSFETQNSLKMKTQEIEKYKEKLFQYDKAIFEYKATGRGKITCMIVGTCQNYKQLHEHLISTPFFQKTNCKAKLVLKVGSEAFDFEEEMKKQHRNILKDIKRKSYQSNYELEGTFEEITEVVKRCCENQYAVIKNGIARWNAAQKKKGIGSEQVLETKISVLNPTITSEESRVSKKGSMGSTAIGLDIGKPERNSINLSEEESKLNVEIGKDISSTKTYREIQLEDSLSKRLNSRSFEYKNLVTLLKNKFQLECDVKAYKFSIQSLWERYKLTRAAATESMTESSLAEVELVASCSLDPGEIGKLCGNIAVFNEKIKLRDSILIKEDENDLVGDTQKYAVFIIFLVFLPNYNEINKIYCLSQPYSAYPLYSVFVPV